MSYLGNNNLPYKNIRVGRESGAMNLQEVTQNKVSDEIEMIILQIYNDGKKLKFSQYMKYLRKQKYTCINLKLSLVTKA